jgi:hypothetical protein
MHAMLLRVAEAAQAASPEQWYRDWEAWSNRTLEAADLPPWSETIVFLDAHGLWERARPPYQKSGVETIHLRELINRQYGPQSIQRYAYDILDELFQLHTARISQDIAAVERTLHRLHGLVLEVTIKVDWETDAHFGRQVREERRRGGRIVPNQTPRNCSNAIRSYNKKPSV